jgi:hypothetical protein
LSPAPSYVCLTLLQALTVFLPRGRARGASRNVAWVLAPAVALGAGVAILRVVAGGPHALALVAAVAAPALAAAGPVRLPVAAALWLVAWLAHGLVAQAAEVALIALAAATIASVTARFTTPRTLAVALVLLAALDVVLVWGTPQVQPASHALHAVSLPHGIPRLQDATFGDAQMGWLDLVAPALLGVAVQRRLRAAAATWTAALLFGLLLLVTSTLPGTVPTLAGLVCASL